MEKVILSDGRVATQRRIKVKDIANAENQAGRKEYLVKYAIMGAKILIDNKPVVLEDILELAEDDLILIGDLFEDSTLKNV